MTTSPPASQSAPAAKAGRNLAAAIGVGAGLAAVVVASLAFRKELFAAVMALAILVAIWELRQALGREGLRVSVIPLGIGAVSMIVAALLRGPEALILTFGLTCVGLLIWRVADGVAGAATDVAASTFVAFYPAFLAGFPALMLAAPDGALRVIFFILVTVCSDIGGYVAGVFLGKHPMAPSVSPKKSWEGFAGSVLLCAVAGAVSMVRMFDHPWWQGALIGVLTAAAATLGDLVESLLKRDLGVKDMSSFLPGHGGIMDRLDSLVVTAPLMWLLLSAFVPVG